MLSLRCQKKRCFLGEIIPGLFKTYRTPYLLFTRVTGLVLSYWKNSERDGKGVPGLATPRKCVLTMSWFASPRTPTLFPKTYS